MLKLTDLDPRLQARVSHIVDEATALKVIRAMSDCCPAHALMDLVRNHGFDLNDCAVAYKSRYNRKSWAGWSLQGAEQEEFEFERINDI